MQLLLGSFAVQKIGFLPRLEGFYLVLFSFNFRNEQTSRQRTLNETFDLIWNSEVVCEHTTVYCTVFHSKETNTDRILKHINCEFVSSTSSPCCLMLLNIGIVAVAFINQCSNALLIKVTCYIQQRKKESERARGDKIKDRRKFWWYE